MSRIRTLIELGTILWYDFELIETTEWGKTFCCGCMGSLKFENFKNEHYGILNVFGLVSGVDGA